MIAVSDDWSPSMKEKLVKVLLVKDVDSLMCTPSGDNLLHLCTKYCESDALCRHLIKSMDIDLGTPNGQGLTPLAICDLLKRPMLAKSIREVQVAQNEFN